MDDQVQILQIPTRGELDAADGTEYVTIQSPCDVEQFAASHKALDLS